MSCGCRTRMAPPKASTSRPPPAMDSSLKIGAMWRSLFRSAQAARLARRAGRAVRPNEYRSETFIFAAFDCRAREP